MSERKIKKSWIHKVEPATIDCPNPECNRTFSVKMIEEPMEFDCETGKPTETAYELAHGEKVCRCGASVAVVDSFDGAFALWLNEKNMPTKEELKKKYSRDRAPKLPQGQTVLA